jgi:hypothetical protein
LLLDGCSITALGYKNSQAARTLHLAFRSMWESRAVCALSLSVSAILQQSSISFPGCQRDASACVDNTYNPTERFCCFPLTHCDISDSLMARRSCCGLLAAPRPVRSSKSPLRA